MPEDPSGEVFHKDNVRCSIVEQVQPAVCLDDVEFRNEGFATPYSDKRSRFVSCAHERLLFSDIQPVVPSYA
jgi:hypothetical protein